MADVVDPTLFAGKPLNPEDIYTLQGAAGAGTDQQYVPPASVPQAALQATDPNVLAGNASRNAADRERATWLESLGASVSNWDTLHLLKNVFTDDHIFEATLGYNGSEFVQQLPMQLTEPEMQYMLKAQSVDDSKYRLEDVQTRRSAMQAAGDNSSAAFAGAALDPAYWMLTPAAAGLSKTLQLGRAGAAVGAGAGAVGIQLGAGGPIATSDLVTNALLNGAAGAMIYKAGKGLVKADPDFPDEALRAKATEVPRPVNTDAKVVVKEVDTALKTKAQELGEAGQWNMRKTMSGFGTAGKKVADLLFDNNSDLAKTSVEAERASIRSDLTSLQRVYEDGLMAALKEDGHGMLKRLFKPGEASKAQAKIESEVQDELRRREQLTRQDRPVSYENVSPRVKAMADSLDALHSRALKELKAAGVEGAEGLVEKAGWHHRAWSGKSIEDMTEKFVAAGQTAEKAHQSVVKLLQGSLRRANGWDAQLSYDVAASVINRALRKGRFEDSIMNGVADEGTLKQMRDILKEEGVTGQRLERVLEVMRQKADDTGKAGFLQHRVDMDYKAGTLLNGEMLRVTDLMDNRLTHTVDRYLDGVSTQAALARKGLTKRSDISKLREELIAGIPDHKTRGDAAQLFDNVINHMQGNPAGEDVPRAMRLMSSYGRMISLANSGLWQTTEYATMMAKYGALKSIKYAMAEAPGFKGLLETAAKDKRTSGHLKDILTRHSEQNTRLRPYIQRFEDNFSMGAEDTMQLAAQQGQQLVPYVNAMKFVHGHQARVTSNLILNRLEMAAKGDANASNALQKYGLDAQVMDKLKPAMSQHGFNVDKWGPELWAQVRPAFAKMMDESVLHQRMGDMPAFAAFDKVGKFIFTYRSFMLSAHNKILMGTLARDGSTPATLLLAYQFPLAALAVQAQSGMQGKGALSTKEMSAKAVGQMGGFGVLSEVAGVLTGQKSAFGSPGTIPIDRAYKLVGSVAQGDAGQAGATALSMAPLVGLLPPVKALGNLMKE